MRASRASRPVGRSSASGASPGLGSVGTAGRLWSSASACWCWRCCNCARQAVCSASICAVTSGCAGAVRSSKGMVASARSDSRKWAPVGLPSMCSTIMRVASSAQASSTGRVSERVRVRSSSSGSSHSVGGAPWASDSPLFFGARSRANARRIDWTVWPRAMVSRAASVWGVAWRARSSAMDQPMEPDSRAVVKCGSDWRRRVRVRVSAAQRPPRLQRSREYAPKVEKPRSWMPSASRWRAWPIRRRRRPAPRDRRWSSASSWVTSGGGGAGELGEWPGIGARKGVGECEGELRMITDVYSLDAERL